MKRIAHNFVDITGQRFGKRTVIERRGNSIWAGHETQALWLVRCDCGKESIINTQRAKESISCGCDLESKIRSGLTRRNPVSAKIRANNSHRLNFFKLSPDDFQRKIAEQENRCALCGDIFIRTPHVDHDHSCCSGSRTCGNCIRGLLCHSCNTGLGNFRDNPILLQKAIEYLRSKRNATIS